MSHETSKAHLGCIVSVPKVVAVHNVVARRRGLSSARQEERFSPISTRRRLTFVKLLSDEGRGLPLFHPSTSLQQFADAEYMPMQAREQQPQSTVRPASGLTYVCIYLHMIYVYLYIISVYLHRVQVYTYIYTYIYGVHYTCLNGERAPGRPSPTYPDHCQL